MAGEWIKMRTNLWDDPRVASMCDLTGLGEAAVIGGLYWLWSMADEHTEDGFLPRLTLSAIDRKTGIKGLADSLVSVGWIEVGEAGVRILSFEEHNGASAKRRCMEAKRKAESRDSPGDPHDVRNVSASDADKTRTESGSDAELDKRREDKNSPSLRSGEGKARGKRKPVSIPMPDDFAISERVLRWAAEKKFGQLPEHLEAFKAKVKAKGYQYVDWDSAFMEAVREDWAKLRSRQVGGQGPPTETAYQRSMRERVEQAAGSMAHIVAAKPPGQKVLEPWEVAANEQRTIESGTRPLALGVD